MVIQTVSGAQLMWQQSLNGNKGQKEPWIQAKLSGRHY